MSRWKALLTLVLSAAIISCFCFHSAAYQFTDYCFSGDVRFCTSGDDVCLASSNGNQLYIEKIAPDSLSRTLTLPYAVTDFDVSLNTASAICNDEQNSIMTVFFYDIYADYLDCFSVSGVTHRNSAGYALNENGLYICDSNNRRVINRYSYSGKLEYYYELGAAVSCIFQDAYGAVYAIANNSLFRLDLSSIVNLSGDAVFERARFIASDMIADLSGAVYSLSSGTTSRLFQVQSGSCAYAGAIDGSCYIPDDSSVYRYTSDGIKTGVIQLDASVVFLCTSGDLILAFTNENGVRVNQLYDSDFEDIGDSVKSDYSDSGNSSNSGYFISSDVYQIDEENSIIYGIPPKTTLSVFRQNIRYDGYSLDFYKDGTHRKSGNISTAMTSEFSSSDRVVYELSVNGDLTGEGNVNSKDRFALMDFLLDKWQFSGAYLYSADLNHDGCVDLLDTVLLCEMIDK